MYLATDYSAHLWASPYDRARRARRSNLLRLICRSPSPTVVSMLEGTHSLVAFNPRIIFWVSRAYYFYRAGYTVQI